MKQAVLFSLALILLSNGLTLFSYSAGIDRQLVYLPWACALLAMALGWGRTYGGLSWKDIGLSGGPWKTSLLVGIASGLALALPLVLFLAFPFLFARPVQYSEIESLDRFGLLWRLGVELTLATALTEEILFRGILQALFKRSSSTVQALVLTNVVFALWHLGINACLCNKTLWCCPCFNPPRPRRSAISAPSSRSGWEGSSSVFCASGQKIWQAASPCTGLPLPP